MASGMDEIRRLCGDPQVARLVETFRAQVGSSGRAHHRKLLKAMRAASAAPLTEPMQELALTLKGKLGCRAPKPRGVKAPRAESFAYLPGCLTTESAREYDASIRLVAKALGLALDEIDDWNCCGAGIVQQADAQAAAALARRNVERAGAKRMLVSGCPICIARTQEAAPETPATHLLGILTRPDVLAKLAEKVKATGQKRPVGSLKVAPFYGCALADRALWTIPSPPRGEGVPAPIETLMEAAGATALNWGGLKRCCGGYLLYARPDLGFEMLEKVFRDFEKSGADAIVTACPHCHFNLDAFQFAIGRARKRALDVPILHFTEVLALAMNLDAERGFERHVTSAFPLVERLVNEESKRQAAEARAAKKKARP